ncbi:MAG: hypothetical protein ABJL71_05400, partial [Cyclobacteriaceae bacterium]
MILDDEKSDTKKWHYSIPEMPSIDIQTINNRYKKLISARVDRVVEVMLARFVESDSPKWWRLKAKFMGWVKSKIISNLRSTLRTELTERAIKVIEDDVREKRFLKE